MITLTYYDNADSIDSMVQSISYLLDESALSLSPVKPDEEFPIQYKITVTIEEVK